MGTPRKGLTADMVLDELRDFIEQNGYAPTSRELGDECGVCRQMADKYIARLEREGRIHVHRVGGRRRGIAIL